MEEKPRTLLPEDTKTALVHIKEEPRKLEELLSDNVVHLSCESSAESSLCDVYLIGTCHISVTQQRAWGKLSPAHKHESIHRLLSSLSSPTNPEDLNETIDPAFEETMIDERDQYMSYFLYQIASENTHVVAVVGKSHLSGIERYWKQPIEMDKLMQIPD